MQLKKKIKLFIFQPYPKFGGADRSIIKLINGIKHSDITVISLEKCNYSKYLNKKIKFKILKSKRTFFSILELRQYIKNETIKYQNKKNILISNQHFANIVSMISLNKLKNIKTNRLESSSTTIVAKEGLVREKDMILFNGQIISENKSNLKNNIVKFEQLNIDLNNLQSGTIKQPKLQETNTLILLKCVFDIGVNELANCYDTKNSRNNISKAICCF